MMIEIQLQVLAAWNYCTLTHEHIMFAFDLYDRDHGYTMKMKSINAWDVYSDSFRRLRMTNCSDIGR